MRYCPTHNRFYGKPTCPRCETRVVEEAGRLPLRVTDPQEHRRCHRCWSLEPVCRCHSPKFVGEKPRVPR